MIGLLALMLLRPLLAPLARLGTNFLAAALLAIGAELLAERFLDADLPRSVALALLVVLAAAWGFLRSRWRRAGIRIRRGRAGTGGAEMVQESLGGGAAGPGRISRR
jgi:hypothetical protein